MGVTASLLLKAGKIPISCLFAETHSNLPDSEAAARIVETLDGYLGFKIDVKPLFEQAKKFESSLKQYIEKSRGMLDQKQKKELKKGDKIIIVAGEPVGHAGGVNLVEVKICT